MAPVKLGYWSVRGVSSYVCQFFSAAFESLFALWCENSVDI